MIRRLNLDLPARTAKPRQSGLTNIVINGASLSFIKSAFEETHAFIDIAKFGWGLGYIMPNLEDMVDLCRQYDIRPCLGGMMFEISYWQGKQDDYAAWLLDMGFDLVEVSNGSLPIPEAEKCSMVENYANRGFEVLSEVGSKDIKVVSPPEDWAKAVQNDLNAGAWKVILEGRADASAGIYNSDGSTQDDIVGAVFNCGITCDELIIEAPHKRQMTTFIHQFGANVNFGNVPLTEVMNLESLRLGLRGDTVNHFHADHKVSDNEA